MTTNGDDDPPGRVHRPDRTQAAQPHEKTERRAHREGRDLDPQDAAGQGSDRNATQGRGGDPDRRR